MLRMTEYGPDACFAAVFRHAEHALLRRDRGAFRVR